MTISRDIVLGDRTFTVPPLPLRHNRVVYPLCRDLSVVKGEGDSESFMGRLLATGGTPDAVRDDEWPKLEQIALHAAMAADAAFNQAEFDALAIRPSQLIDAFFVAKIQTGVWVPLPAETAGETVSGEAEGAEVPQ